MAEVNKDIIPLNFNQKHGGNNLEQSQFEKKTKEVFGLKIL